MYIIHDYQQTECNTLLGKNLASDAIYINA